MTDTDIVVIGAGVAGLAAAAKLRADGQDCLVIEAADRIGGRAHTTSPASLHGAWIDHGATWLHNAERNPLADVARATGETIIESDTARRWRLQIGTREVTPIERHSYDTAWQEFDATVRVRATAEPDIAFTDAMRPLNGNPWAATIELWEAAQIAAADPTRLSLRDWFLNDLDGTNLIIEGGIGAFVARRLGPAAGNVELDTPAIHVDWRDSIIVDTPKGTIRARAAIVTVSTGVLAEHLRFTPDLPDATRAAIAALPMGLLTKIALPEAEMGRLGLPENLSLRRQVVVGEPAMSFTAWPLGRPYVQGFVGGPTAWALSRAGAAATEDFARGQIRALLGADADRALGPAFVADWARDPWHRGAYAYATVGNADARAVLATPLADGRLIFAGEAPCTNGLAGTVGGAYLSGANAACTIMAALSRG